MQHPAELKEADEHVCVSFSLFLSLSPSLSVCVVDDGNCVCRCVSVRWLFKDVFLANTQPTICP